METLLLLSALAGLIQLIVIIILIVKFFQISKDVKILRENIAGKKTNFKPDFYKWIAANELEKAKDVLFNQIGNDPKFQQMLHGGNQTYIKQLEEQVNNTYKKELSMIGIENIDFPKM